MRACPSCRRSWPEGRETCPRCLTTLVAALDATVTCPECGRVCPAQMQSCPSCLALLRRKPLEADEDVVNAHRVDVEDDSWVDDQWSLDTTSGHLPVQPLAFVALAVAAKVLLGRPEPERLREEREQDPRDPVDDLGPVARSIIDGFLS